MMTAGNYYLDEDNFIVRGSDNYWYHIEISKPPHPIMTFTQIDSSDFIWRGKHYNLLGGDEID